MAPAGIGRPSRSPDVSDAITPGIAGCASVTRRSINGFTATQRKTARYSITCAAGIAGGANRAGYGAGRGLIPGRVSIAERPAIVQRRARFGDWEGDTLEGARSKGGIASLVERKSRYVLAAPLCDKSAAVMAAEAVKVLKWLPKNSGDIILILDS